MAAAAGLPAQDPDPGAPRLVVPYRPHAIEVDGSLEDWGAKATLRFHRPEQMWEAESRGGWGGLTDISAELHLAYDETHLYVGGRVRDDSFVHHEPGQRSEEADAIELFFNFDLGDDLASGGSDEPVPFNADDVQVFLMPLDPARPWDMVAFTPESGPQARPTLTGLRIARQDNPPEQYTFEAVIPWHHFPSLEPGRREIGFFAALDDWDVHRDRYAYMTWTGENAVSPPDTRKMGRLVFGGAEDPTPLESLALGDTGLSRALRQDLPFILGPIAAVLGLLVMLRWWSRLRSRWPAVRPVVRIVGVVLFGVGLLLPGWWTSAHNRAYQDRLGGVADTLSTAIPKMEAGTLASYRGPNRDAPLIDLLEGRSIARQKYFTYEPLAELVEDGFGPPPVTFPNDYFEVLPYWVPLPLEAGVSFDFPQSIEGHSLYIAVAWPFQMYPVEGSGPLPEISLSMQAPSRPDAAGSPVVASVIFNDPPQYGHPFGRESYAVGYRTVPLTGPVGSIKITNLNREGLRLLGLTLVPSEHEAGRPLRLGQVSDGGIPTDLRGPYPRRAGVEVVSGRTEKVRIPGERAQPYDKLWLFYGATYPGQAYESLPTGTPVAEVRVHFTNKKLAPKVMRFTHQETMFFVSSKHNLTEPAEDSLAQVAFTWQDENEERLLNLVRSMSLPPGETVEAIEFQGLAPYPVRFRSVVFGSERQAAPQDPPDSPLVATAGGGRRLVDEVLGRIEGASVAIFRGGRVTEKLVGDPELDWSGLPREVAADLAAAEPDEVVARQVAEDDGEGRRYEAYVPLVGDGWDGAALGIALRAPSFGVEQRWSHLVGLFLCLAATPLLLILFSEVLTVLNNLRLRLMVVIAVATLVPLAVLSLVLVRVLESGHDADLEAGLRSDLDTTLSQLEEYQVRLFDSGNRWLVGLAKDFADDTVEDASAEEAAEALRASMEESLATRLPEDWGGGYLQLEFQPDVASGTAIAPFTVVEGDRLLASAETPLRTEPGIYLSWGRPLIGVRCEQPVPGGRLALSLGRPVEEGLLTTLAPGRALLLTDMRGYPLAAGGGGPLTRETLLEDALRPGAMQERRRAAAAAMDKGQPIVRRAEGPRGTWLLAHRVLRDLQDTPRAVLALVQPHTRASLELAFGALPVRAFFLLVAGLLVVLAVFLSFVVTSRISRPIEQLEHGAQAISRGDLGVRVTTEEGGQIGRLTRTFNEMAQDLQGRIQDLSLLNRAIRDLNARLDLDETLTGVRLFYEQQSPADRVRIALFDRARQVVELHGGGEVVRLDPDAADVAVMADAAGAFCAVLDREPLASRSAVGAAVPGARSMLVLPMVLGRRVVGAVVLLFERPRPLAVELGLLSTMAAQAAVAVENARLFLQAVRDPITGAWRPDSFRQHVTEAVARAADDPSPVALFALRCGESGALAEVLSAEGLQTVVEGLAGAVRRVLPEEAILGHFGAGEFQVAVPGVDRAAAEGLLGRMLDAWRAAPVLAALRHEHPPQGGFATYPEDAASAEILFDALQRGAAGESGDAAQELVRHLEDVGVFATSPAMRDVYRTIRRVAPTELTLLLEGETGVGKEVMTNLIHRWSRRAQGPLVKVHCAALSEALLQSELFGHEKGAFTGATSRKLGRFELAQGGTLFLDEIGEISLDTQVKLLRVLQEREIERVGGSQPIPVDVRIVAATNRDIRAMVAEGTFREDLYYRLQGMVLRIPSLRERRPEIPELVEFFRREAVENGQTAVEGFTPEALDVLYRRDWPGNIRELRNTVFRAVVLASGPLVTLAELQGTISEEGGVDPVAGAAAPARPRSVVPVVPPPPVPADGHASPSGNGGAPDRPEEAAADLPPRLRSLLELVARRGPITTMQYVEKAGVSRRTGLRDLQQLVDLGLIERVGKRRGARYRLRSA